MSDDFDLRAIIRYLKPENLVRWAVAIGIAAAIVITVIFYAAWAWNHS